MRIKGSNRCFFHFTHHYSLCIASLFMCLSVNPFCLFISLLYEAVLEKKKLHSFEFERLLVVPINWCNVFPTESQWIRTAGVKPLSVKPYVCSHSNNKNNQICVAVQMCKHTVTLQMKLKVQIKKDKIVIRSLCRWNE